jgi:transcriptional regulator with XRE-family HTH domain
MHAAPSRSGLTGRDLAADRVRLGLRQIDVAAEMGISQSRLSRIELDWKVTETMADRYYAALQAVTR